MVGRGNQEDRKIQIGIQGQSAYHKQAVVRFISLHEKLLDGFIVRFSIKRNLQLRKLLLKFCEEKKLDYGSTQFLYNGRRLLVRKTPDELHMVNGDVIDAMVHVHAG